MMELESSVFASGYEAFQIIQYIEQLTYQIFRGDTLFIEDLFSFLQIHCKFFDEWNSEEIAASTYHLYSDRAPAKYDAKRCFNVWPCQHIAWASEKIRLDIQRNHSSLVESGHQHQVLLKITWEKRKENKYNYLLVWSNITN